MSSSSDRVSLSGSGSERSGDSGSSRDDITSIVSTTSIISIAPHPLHWNPPYTTHLFPITSIISTTSTISTPLTTRT